MRSSRVTSPTVAPGVDRPGQVRLRPSQHGERVVEPGVGGDLRQPPHPLRTAPGVRVVGEVEDVLDVQVADQLAAVAGAHREPGEPGLARRRRATSSTIGCARQRARARPSGTSTSATVCLRRAQRAGQPAASRRRRAGPRGCDSAIRSASSSGGDTPAPARRAAPPASAAAPRSPSTLNSQMTGRITPANARNGGTSQIAVRSGPAIAMFFGTISPITMCSDDHDAQRDRERDRVAAPTSGSPSQLQRPLDQVGHRGLAEAAQQQRADRDAELGAGEHARTGRAPARSTAAARRTPERASASSRSRRAEISANSAPTKNALRRAAATATSRRRGASDVAHVTAGPPETGRAGTAAARRPGCGRGASRCSCHPSTSTLVADVAGCGPGGRAPARRASRTRRRGIAKPVASATSSSRSSPDTSQLPRLRAAAPGPARPVVLVAHVADDLLDQVLEGDDARGAAVLVDDDGELQPGLPQPGEQRVAVERLRHGRHGLGQRSRSVTLGPLRDGHAERLLDVHHADERRPGRRRAPGTGRSPAAASRRDQVGDGVVGVAATRPAPAASSGPRRPGR